MKVKQHLIVTMVASGGVIVHVTVDVRTVVEDVIIAVLVDVLEVVLVAVKEVAEVVVTELVTQDAEVVHIYNSIVMSKD
ncbi:MAG: hypothetical protein E7079_01690 [Bacteroidales bacterium]|nr:hypothetical protein [Bacteroidales bacterium]